MPSHADLVLAQLSSQRQWGFLCDVAVVIGDTQFRAHRAVLAACSALFRMFFIQDSRGQQSPDLSLDLSHTGVSAQSFDRILQYMYQGHSTANNSAELSELKEAMLQLQMDFVPESLEELSRAQAPGSGSRLMFGVRMFPTRPDANANLRAAPESSSSTGNSRPLSVEELPLALAPPLGEEPCDLRRSLRKPERLKERPRFGRTFTCDDCGFVFSCEKLLIEHILTCTNRKNPPTLQRGAEPGERGAEPEHGRRAGSEQSGAEGTDLLKSRVKSEPEDWTRIEPGPGLVASVTVKSEPEDPEPGGAQIDPDPDSKRIKLEPGTNPDPEQEEETHCELCGVEVKDLTAHYVSAHTSHMCACGRCGAVLPKGRRLQEHAQRCAERLNPDRDPDRDPDQDQHQQEPNPDPDQTQDLQDLPELQDQPENPEEESEEEEQEEEEEMEACPLLDNCENAGSSLAGLPPAAFSSEEPRRRHFCGICGRGFFQRCHLREHYTVHTKHKQFTCVTCGKGFLRQRQLRLHQDMHRGVARYVCPVCDQGTFLKQDHVRHMISHLSPGETICQVCFQMFPGPAQLEEHMEVHLYICYVCGDKFRLRKDMRSHVHLNHSKRV